MAISADDVFDKTMTKAQREEAARRGAKLIEERAGSGAPTERQETPPLT